MFLAQSNTAYNAGAEAGMLFGALVVIVILLIPWIFYCLTLQKALNRCSPENRAMQPGMVWLLLIPLVNLVWNFMVVLNMSKSLGAEFQKRGMAEDPQPGKTVGMTMAILICCGVIPIVGFLASIAGLICWVIYWVKIVDYSKKLA